MASLENIFLEVNLGLLNQTHGLEKQQVEQALRKFPVKFLENIVRDLWTSGLAMWSPHKYYTIIEASGLQFDDVVLIASVSQDDKDLVHEFVNSDGLSALISVGQDADQNYQNYILRGREMTSQLFYCRIHPSMEYTGYKTMGKFEDIINTIIAHPDKMCQVLQVFLSNRYFGKSNQTKNPQNVNRILRN